MLALEAEPKLADVQNDAIELSSKLSDVAHVGAVGVEVAVCVCVKVFVCVGVFVLVNVLVKVLVCVEVYVLVLVAVCVKVGVSPHAEEKLRTCTEEPSAPQLYML